MKTNIELTAEWESLVRPGITNIIGVVSSLEIALLLWKPPSKTENLIKSVRSIFYEAHRSKTGKG